MEHGKRKVLIVTTVSGFVPQFELKNVYILQKMNYEVHYAANYHNPVYSNDNDRLKKTGIIQHQIDFVRSPYKIISNIKAYLQLIRLMKTQEFHMVHCHTPMGSLLARLAAKHNGIYKVIYTAHGFHFFKGAPLKNWLLYYPMEVLFARITDCLITINQEDYQRAHKFKLRNNNHLYKVNGVGINTDSYSNEHRKLINNTFKLITVGELSKRKNQIVLIKALAILRDKDIKLTICGKGPKMNHLKHYAEKNNVLDQVEFKGYCTNIKQFLVESDCFVFPSLQEGLPVALMEAMAAGLPVICTNIRGNRDLINHNEGGILVDTDDVNSFAKAIKYLKSSELVCKRMGQINMKRIKEYDSLVVEDQMMKIYSDFLR